MSPDNNDSVSGFNSFGEENKKVQRKVEYSFAKKVVVELILIPLVTLVPIWIEVVLFEADPNFEIAWGDFYVRGSIFVVGPFLVLLLYYCKFPDIWYQMYQFKIKYMKTILRSLKRS